MSLPNAPALNPAWVAAVRNLSEGYYTRSSVPATLRLTAEGADAIPRTRTATNDELLSSEPSSTIQG
jgi:hypothetical protein